VLLLTGRPGIGKTTALRAVAAAVGRARRVAGFYTEEIRARGVRSGFRIVTLDGDAAVMADVSRHGGPRVGKYGVDVAAIEAIAVPAIAPRRAVDVYFIDEIGKMECLAPAFVAAMRTLLDSPATVIATVAERGGGFIAEVKRRAVADTWPLTRANRDDVVARVLAWLDIADRSRRGA
jgi:nucleoside-triphosphatase